MSQHSTLLFAIPRPWEGIGRLIDLGGTFDQYNESSNEVEADTRATTQDWTAVADDLYSAGHAWSTRRE